MSSSSLAFTIAWSRPEPASMQTISRSSASGSPFSICFWRASIWRPSHRLGQHDSRAPRRAAPEYQPRRRRSSSSDRPPNTNGSDDLGQPSRRPPPPGCDSRPPPAGAAAASSPWATSARRCWKRFSPRARAPRSAELRQHAVRRAAATPAISRRRRRCGRRASSAGRTDATPDDRGRPTRTTATANGRCEESWPCTCDPQYSIVDDACG